MTNQTDREVLKSVVKEILTEDTRFLKSVVQEILTENQIIGSDKQKERSAKLEAMIKEDFDRFDVVFKKLA
ncbi:MAG: hypothetical protein AAF847_08220 [Bacteroidota bacterium]